jgi:hypothetical protein
MADGQVVFEIEGDNRGIRQALTETTDAINKESRKWDKAGEDSANDIGDAFSGMFKKISMAAMASQVGKVLLDFGKDAIQAASALEEVQNVVDVTFGASADQIDKWAKNAITQFGLTETQAKRYTSTIGAMMKSMGLSGDAVTKMSEDLAGLAADMASFYNLDFDTAFAKIRSGISGETEPLKQLGINMSQANIEAFMLQQGIAKTWKEMSASEQAMIRYQYLMQATSDAQGDFARTTDGVANGTRLLENQLETLKTKLGEPLKNAFGAALVEVNKFLAVLMPDDEEKERHTILDDLAEIDLKTENKILQIRNTASEARALLTVFEEIAGNSTVPEVVGEIAKQANTLNASSPATWESILGAFADANFTGLNSQTGLDIKALAEGLSGIGTEYQSKKEAWSALLGVLRDNVDTISSLTGKSPDEIKSYLDNIADSANGLDDGAGDAWDSLLTSLVTYLGPAITDESLQLLAGNMGGIKDSANGLDTSTSGNWETFLKALTGINGLENIWGEGESAKQKIQDLASALSGGSITTTKAQAWSDMIDALLKSEALNGLPDDKLEAVKGELTGIKEAAQELDPDDVEAWNSLFARLLEVPGLDESDEGKRLIDILSGTYEGFASAAHAAETAQQGMEEATGDAANEQARLLNLSRQMVALIPALSNAFDEQSGKMKLTDGEIRKIISDWEEYETWAAKYRGAKEKKAAVEADTAHVEETVTEVDSARSKLMLAMTKAGKTSDEARRFADRLKSVGQFGWASYLAGDGTEAGDLYTPYWFGEVAKGNATFGARGSTQFKQGKAAQAWYVPGLENRAARDIMFSLKYATDDVREATIAYYTALFDAAEAEYAHGVAVELVTEEYETAKDKADEYAQSIEAWTTEEAEAVGALVDKYNEALAAAMAYYNEVRNGVASSVQSVISGFGKLETAAQRAKNNTKSGDVAEEGTSVVQGDGISAGSMRAGLQSQLDYMQNYQKMLGAAQAAGFSDEVIAALSDGSTESYDYLAALFKNENGKLVQNFTKEDVDEINRLYQEVGNEREKFVDDLTARQLAVDDTWKELNQTVTEAANTLTDKVTALGLTTADMMTNMINGIKQKAPELATNVKAVADMIAYLESHGFHASATGGLTYGTTIVSGPGKPNGPYANGLDYVPRDGFLAALDKGESVLNAEEAAMYRAGNPGVDIGAMIADMGGDVYLDGRIVGRVISERQGDSYRALERSGWRG